MVGRDGEWGGYPQKLCLLRENESLGIGFAVDEEESRKFAKTSKKTKEMLILLDR